MTGKRRAAEDQRDCTPDAEDERNPRPDTLGAVLYADKDTEIPLEKEWVELVHLIAAGDQLALHALYERAHRPVFTLTMRIAKNRQTAEELTIDVFHDVWRRASKYDPGGGTVLGWILNQARSRAIDRLRFEGRLKRLDPQSEDWRQWTAPRDSEDAIALTQQAELLRNALTVLTPDEQRAIETAYFSGLTYAEAAERLNESLGTVKTRIRSGLAKLREALVGRGKR
jgi:RNA polymerase sigma-70 factor (ECF subfamily)